MKDKGLFGEFVAEIFGTFILVLLGVGVVVNVGLAPRMAAGSAFDWLLINTGWALAVVIAVYAVAGVSGAHLNPAVTLALAVKRGFPWGKVPAYMVAQVIGAFLGAVALFLTYRDGLVGAGFPNVWTGGPGSVFAEAWWGNPAAREAIGSYSLFTATFAEAIGTAVLLWGVMMAFDQRNMAVGANLGPLIVALAVFAVGTSLGGPTGYMINPARDFGPRLFGALIGTQGMFDGIYWLVAPIIGPLIGGVAGIFIYDWCVTPFLPAASAASREEVVAGATVEMEAA
jgi:glycerol uptake facilitator protein